MVYLTVNVAMLTGSSRHPAPGRIDGKGGTPSIEPDRDLNSKAVAQAVLLAESQAFLVLPSASHFEAGDVPTQAKDVAVAVAERSGGAGQPGLVTPEGNAAVDPSTAHTPALAVNGEVRDWRDFATR